MNPSRYTLRVSVKVLGKEPIKGLETEPSMAVGQLIVAVKQRWPYLILVIRDFASEAEAEAFLPQIKAGLWGVAIEHNIAFRPEFERRTITRPIDPKEAARNLAKAFGQPVKGPISPVHGLTDEGGYTIFNSDENIRYMAMGEATGYVSTSWEHFGRILSEGMRNARSLKERLDADFVTAIDLYLASFYETSIRARLLTLITCLEVLAPITERHAAVVELLSGFERRIEERLAKVTESDERDALEALRREIDFKKETSIRRRVRHLVLSEAPLSGEARAVLAKEVVNAYDRRGTVVHAGSVDSKALHEAHEIALRAVKLLLRARLGFAE